MQHLRRDSIPKMGATMLLQLLLCLSLLTGFLPRGSAQAQPVPLYQADGVFSTFVGETEYGPSLLTTNVTEYNQAVARGYVGLGIVGRVYTDPAVNLNLVSLYRFHIPFHAPDDYTWGNPENYIYKTNRNPPYLAEGPPVRVGYVFRETGLDLAPLRVLHHENAGIYRYTTDRSVYLSANYPWLHEGIICYVVAEPPSVPQNLRVAAGNKVVNLAWDVSPQAATYQLYRSLTSGGQGSVPYKTGIPKSALPQYADTAVINDTAYYYKVVAVDSSGRLSAFSNEVRAIPMTPTGTNPNPWAKFRANNSNTGIAGAGTRSRLGPPWQFYVGGVGGPSSPALDSSGMVYVGSGIGKVFKLDPKWETVVWEYQTLDAIQSSPVLGNDGSVYVGSLDGCLYALRPDGTLKWRFGPLTMANGLRAPIASSPAVGTNGSVYFGGGDGFVYALNAATGAKRWQYPPTRSVGFMSSPAIGSDGTVYIGGRDFNLHAINGTTGAKKWTYPTRSWVESSPAIGGDGTVYVGSFDGSVYAVTKDGVRKWTFGPTGASFNASPTLSSDGTLYIGSVRGNFYALNSATGAVKWSLEAVAGELNHPRGGIWASASLSPDGRRVFIPVDNGYVYSLETATGIARDFFQTFTFNHSSPAIGPLGEMYVGSDRGIIFMGKIY